MALTDPVPAHFHRAGLFRREVLQVGFLGAFGISMLDAFTPARAQAAPELPQKPRGARAKSVILVWMPGGPPQMHLWDLKPDSPAECRGTARPIRTTAPGIPFGHWLPLLAGQAHHLALLRTVTLNAEDDNHNLGHHKLLSAVNFKPAGSGDYASRFDWPGMGAVVSAFKQNETGLPASILLPFQVIERAQPLPGQLAGWMGGRFDPWAIEQDPNAPDFHVPDLMPLPGFSVERLEGRKRLLREVDRYRKDLDRELSVRQLNATQERAFTVATSAATREAFDLGKEPERLRERYGRHLFGQSLLLARRLAGCGVRFVQVNLGGENHWDFHQREDAMLQERVPPFDQGFSALLEDLHARGMLEETLVICMGEMGRNPRLGAPTAGGTPGVPDGRNHWQWCWTALFAGGGVRGGAAVGESDEWAAHPNGEAYFPADIGATVYQALGIDPRSEVRDLQDRPVVVNDGESIEKLF
jgi:hypothetical protein